MLKAINNAVTKVISTVGNGAVDIVVGVVELFVYALTVPAKVLKTTEKFVDVVDDVVTGTKVNTNQWKEDQELEGAIAKLRGEQELERFLADPDLYIEELDNKDDKPKKSILDLNKEDYSNVSDLVTKAKANRKKEPPKQIENKVKPKAKPNQQDTLTDLDALTKLSSK